MSEKIKTGLCVFALLLALLAAYTQETAYQADCRAMIQPGPFTAVQIP
ncbi:MAG: hypothetical protein HFF44_04480 [Lawsonibacter sp.]|nr:hypothetical protein [Lawsonibacter sp.]